MEKICEECNNESCKARSDEFREGKVPVCKYMQEHPEEWECSQLWEETERYEDV